MSDLLYLYGFVPTDAPEPLQLRGVGGGAVRLLRLGPQCAVISDLPVEEYGAGSIESRLEDLAWVGEQGLAHEAVVTWYADRSDIVPARLFTLYSGEEALRSRLSPQLAAIAVSLERIRGRREWNLKVAYDAAALAENGADLSEEVRAADAEIASAPPGRRYLLQKRRAELLRRELSTMARRAADDMLAQLATHAVQALTLPIAATDDAGTVVMNAAFLVDRPAEPALTAEAARLHEHYTALGLIISFSGPWAPYRFLELDGKT